MTLKQRLILLLLFFAFPGANAQVLNQPNIDFELGNTSVWKYYTGHCCPLVLDTPQASAVPNRHMLQSTGSVDPYGGFPVVSPGGGNYALKLGNSNTGSQAERAEYYVHVPAGLTDYSLIFRYAVVFENPGHPDSTQPRFAVNAYDSATSETIACAQYLYIASSHIPGFKNAESDTSIKYKEWSTASINLTGYSGRTVIIDFTTGDCAYGAHFGYGYIDMSGGLFAIATTVCNSKVAVLDGPPGFAKYLWYDSVFTTLVDTNSSATLPNPSGPTRYAVVLQPYPGFGCPDTLYTTIYPSHLSLVRQPDMQACVGVSFLLKAEADGAAGNLSYAWTPSSLDCSNCMSVSTSLDTSSSFIIKITDSAGCRVTDTINVEADSCELTIPNAFTPNHDGKNDVFRVLGIGFQHYSNFSLSIFNRFGQLVFYATDIYAGWDGTFNNIPQDLDTYFYMVNYTLLGEHHMLKGDVTLVR